MSARYVDLWAPLAPTPLLWLVVTIAAYLAARRLQRRAGGTPLLNPVLLAIIAVAAVVLMTRTPYRDYFAGAQFIHFLLGPVTVGLAVPLSRNFHYVRRELRGIGFALLAGSLTSIVTGVGLVWLCGGSRTLAFSMAAKAVTTPIAMAVSAQIGGIPALTAALAIGGGIVAATLGRWLLDRLGVADWRAHGLAAGVAGSGIAAAQVVPLGGVAAAFAALGIALNGLVTALLVPLLPLCWHGSSVP